MLIRSRKPRLGNDEGSIPSPSAKPVPFLPSACKADDYEIGRLASRGSNPRGRTIIDHAPDGTAVGLRPTTTRFDSLVIYQSLLTSSR